MKKLKICVYAISKNEEKFANRWYNSMKEADEIFVLDTGSTDNTVSILKSLGVHVKQEIITPFRFDVARNKSLDMIPLDYDICVCTDLDEVFDTGWRAKLEKFYNGENRIGYNYNWSIDNEGKPLISYIHKKIHTRKNYTWIYPVHEVLKYTKNVPEKCSIFDFISLNHYPDRNKSRASYLPLLKLAFKENPKNDRVLHYLGREYMYYNMNDKAIKYLKKHLKLKSSTWKDERSCSMRFIARCYLRKHKINLARKWYDYAIDEAPYLRDPLIEKALLEYNNKNYNEVIFLCNKALDINKNSKTYINEIFSFDHTVYDLLSLCYYYKNEKKLALYYVNKAISINCLDRLEENKKIFEMMND